MRRSQRPVADSRPAPCPDRRRPFIISVVGTRPEAIKMAPVAAALERSPTVEHRVLLTGQHSDLAGHFDLPPERLRQLPFSPRGRTPDGLREALHLLLCGRFQRRRIDLVLVQGDTTSAMAGALAARDCGIPIGHIEAGLRSFDPDQPFPEERHRVAIDELAQLLFAPTNVAAENLHRERGQAGARIWVTGNSGIDALLRAFEKSPPLQQAGAGDRRLILATCHRRENRGEPVRTVCDALKRMVRELPVRVAVPLHPNPHARLGMEEALAGTGHVELLEPLRHCDMVRLMARSWLILTDSGGLQEEAPALGKPVLVLRNVTERPEALATGSLELVGTDTGRIVAAVARLIADPARYERMARPAFPFGDGRASERIVEAIEQWLADRDRG